MKTILILITLLIWHPLTAQFNEAWLRQSSIIFTGTVQEINKSTVKGIPSTDLPVIVKVEEMEVKPDAVTLPKSGLITVLMNKGSEINQRDNYRFYGLGYIFGNELAITEVGHEPPDKTQQDLKKTKQDLLIKDHMKKSNLVASGTVQEIRVPGEGKPGIDSEHDPEWKEAVVILENVIKGPQVKKVIIRFPASNDIAWYKIPKLQQGERGTFILSVDKEITGFKAGVIDGAPVNTYALQDPLDVLPAEDFEKVESLYKQ